MSLKCRRERTKRTRGQRAAYARPWDFLEPAKKMGKHRREARDSKVYNHFSELRIPWKFPGKVGQLPGKRRIQKASHCRHQTGEPVFFMGQNGAALRSLISFLPFRLFLLMPFHWPKGKLDTKRFLSRKNNFFKLTFDQNLSCSPWISSRRIWYFCFLDIVGIAPQKRKNPCLCNCHHIHYI